MLVDGDPLSIVGLKEMTKMECQLAFTGAIAIKMYKERIDKCRDSLEQEFKQLESRIEKIKTGKLNRTES